MSIADGLLVAVFVMALVFALLASIFALIRLSSAVIAHVEKRVH